MRLRVTALDDIHFPLHAPTSAVTTFRLPYEEAYNFEPYSDFVWKSALTLENIINLHMKNKLCKHFGYAEQ